MVKINSFRFCINCEKIKGFVYNRIIHHSECFECGSRFAIKDYDKIKQQIENLREKKSEFWYKTQQKQLKKVIK